MIWEIVLISLSFAVIGYLFGSIIFGAIISKIAKKDVRKTGSRNIGGTNVSRVMGKPMGLLVSFLDAIKGYLAIIVCWIIFRYTIYNWQSADAFHLYPIVFISGIFAVMGHCWPVQYLRMLFKTKFNFDKSRIKSGGKGVSTAGGVVFAISPWLGLIAFGLFVLILLITRYVSLGSIICVFLVSFMIFIPHIDYIYLFNNSLLYPEKYWPDVVSKLIMMIIMLCNSLIVTIRHRKNIGCLIMHKERKFF